ncbi:PspC domain-containing protein [Streptomyces sp. NPDC047928]|uniref:PspC domain-containing protein n=1 Tax=unclassified Streptomyces TaxID=2593676 RepID=UPI00372031FC
MTSTTPAPPGAPASPPHPPLRRTQRQKVVAGVCGGLGRHFDLDPAIFRVATGVLAVAGGIGLIFYGFAWLLITADGEEENEGRRLLSGRVDGASLIAVLMALVGCGLFLSMLGGNPGTITFSVLLLLAVSGAAVWSQRRRLAAGPETPLERAAAQAVAQAVAEAPPETKAPPPPGAPSWWRDPIVKDGTTGPVAIGYLWGPDDAEEGAALPPHAAWGQPPRPARPAAAPAPGPKSIGGLVLLLALIAGGVGTAAAWESHPLGVCLQIGLACALGVFGLGLVVASFLGRTRFGTIFMTVVTALLLGLASLVPPQIGTDFRHAEWIPASVADVRPRYELGTGDATLNLRRLSVPEGETVRTSAEVGAGRLRVVVPAGVTVRVTARVGLGDLLLPNDPPPKQGDVDVSPAREATRTIAPPKGVTPAGTLELDLQMAVGVLEVTRAAP